MGRAILRLHEPTSGEVYFQGKDVLALNKNQMKELRRDMQIVDLAFESSAKNEVIKTCI